MPWASQTRVDKHSTGEDCAQKLRINWPVAAENWEVETATWRGLGRSFQNGAYAAGLSFLVTTARTTYRSLRARARERNATARRSDPATVCALLCTL